MTVRKLANWNVFEEVARESWWLREILDQDDFFFALRDSRVDVYYRGAAVFSIKLGKDTLTVKTHVKYLMRNEQRHATLKQGSFDYGSFEPMQRDYEARKSIADIKAAVKYYVGKEKDGVHKALIDDPKVVDVEVAFSNAQQDADEDGPQRVDKPRKQDRVDAVCLVGSATEARIVFWEAKHFSNGELFTSKVIDQIERYQATISSRKDELVSAYGEVCDFNLRLARLRRDLDIKVPTRGDETLLGSIVAGRTPLVVDEKPRLFVFGFNNEQKMAFRERRHELVSILGGEERLRDIGEPKEARLGQFSM